MFFCLFITLLGMTTTDTWKGIKATNAYLNCVTNLIEILVQEMIE